MHLEPGDTFAHGLRGLAGAGAATAAVSLWLAIPGAQPRAAGLLPTCEDVASRAVRGGCRGVNIAAHHGMAMRIHD
jgi:hypothetical protein